MTKISVLKIKQSLNLTELSISALLALRVLFDDEKDNVDLDQDIAELSIYPERLFASYQDEWCSYICRAIVILCEHNEHADEQSVLNLIQSKVEQIKTHNSERYDKLNAQVLLVQKVVTEDKVDVFPHPLKAQLERFINLK